MSKPYPITLSRTYGFAALAEGDDAAVIRLVPADRIEKVAAIGRAPVSERLAIDDVVGQARDELRGENRQ